MDQSKSMPEYAEIKRRYTPMRVVGVAIFFIVLIVVLGLTFNPPDRPPHPSAKWLGLGVTAFSFCLTFFTRGVRIYYATGQVRSFCGFIVPLYKSRPFEIDRKSHLLIQVDYITTIWPAFTTFENYKVSIGTTRGFYTLVEVPTYSMAWKRAARIADALEMFVKDKTSEPPIFRQPGTKTPLEE